MKHVVSFSGGKDSTAMLLMMIEKGLQIDEIIFCDTGMEFPDMYEHIRKVEKHIGRIITKLKANDSFEYYMFIHEKKNGNVGYGWPDFRNRWCTQMLKKSVVGKYIREIGEPVTEYHGIAADEAHRAEKNKEKVVRYPLIEMNVIEAEALQYCYEKGLDWNGLYEKFDRVSCWCCPLKGLQELKNLYRYYPKYWNRLKRMDELAHNKFRLDYSFEEMEKRFSKEIYLEENQITMWG